jgi:hypothetical protein
MLAHLGFTAGSKTDNLTISEFIYPDLPFELSCSPYPIPLYNTHKKIYKNSEKSLQKILFWPPRVLILL